MENPIKVPSVGFFFKTGLAVLGFFLLADLFGVVEYVQHPWQVIKAKFGGN